jgi:hypothetical protein
MTYQIFDILEDIQTDGGSYNVYQDIIVNKAIPGWMSALQAAGWNPTMGTIYSLYPDHCSSSSVVTQTLEVKCMCCQLDTNVVIAMGYNLGITVSSNKFVVKEASTSSGNLNFDIYILKLTSQSSNSIIGRLSNAAVLTTDSIIKRIMLINNKYILFIGNNKIAYCNSYLNVMYINKGDHLNSLIAFGGANFTQGTYGTNTSGYTIFNSSGIKNWSHNGTYVNGDNNIIDKYILKFYTSHYNMDIYNLAIIYHPGFFSIRAITTDGVIITLNGLDFIVFSCVAVCISV